MVTIAKKTLATKVLICKHCFRTVRASKYCKLCGRCTTCGCTCQYCSDCGKLHKTLDSCGTCGVCRKKCTCKDRPGYNRAIPQITQLKGVQTILNPFNRAVSVEIELTDFRGLHNCSFEYIKGHYTEHDGSVHGSGRELIVPGLLGDTLVLGLSELAAKAEELKCAHDESCGYHVHVDCRDTTALEVYSLLELWEVFAQKIGYRYLFPTRTQCNTYARIIYQATPWYTKLKERLAEAATYNQLKSALVWGICGEKKPAILASRSTKEDYKGKVQQAVGRKYGVNHPDYPNIKPRYMDLNIHSWFYRGTIEFRSHHGTIDSMELVGWALTCLNLVDIAGRHSPATIAAWKDKTIQELLEYFCAPVQAYIRSKLT